MKKLNQQGYNLVELAIAVLILGVIASAVISARSFMAKQTQKTSDKTFATQKSIQMFEELRSLVNGSEKLGVLVLDNFSDGSKYNNMLTTDKTATSPSDPLSGNLARGSGWKYIRQVEVTKVAQDPYARIVTVRVYATNTLNPTQPAELLAESGGLLRTIVTLIPPTQVLDVYIVAISNALGWFTSIPGMQPNFEAAVTLIQALNPGLEIRRHYIQQMGFGRDPLYKPYINEANRCDQLAIPFVYLYPGSIVDENGAVADFFSADQMQNNCGNILLDGSPVTSTGFSIADTFNTGVRYPDELADWAALTTNAAASGSTEPEITLRMLLEGMNSQPQSFTNAIIVNMHGEVLPIPPMRNYSDPAKEPVGNPNVRIVAHPENIHYPSGATWTAMRVYGYYDGMEGGNTPDSFAASNKAATITINLPDIHITSAASISINAIYGGVNAGPVTVAYAAASLATGLTTPSGGMSWTFGNPTSSSTAITLFNTPLRCTQITSGAGNGGGLAAANRLYGVEYIPCPVDNTGTFNLNLTNTTSTTPKNTARWVISLKNLANGQHAIETRIGGDLTTGTLANQPENLSRTYVWVGTTGPGTGAQPWGGYPTGIVPWTERYQFNGDPRHCPYLDVKFGGSDAGMNIDANGYNWYFKDLGSAAATVDGFSGYSKTKSGYDANSSTTYDDDRDMPKYYYMWRRGLLKSQAIFNNLNGWSFWHAAEGGEFGSTYDPYLDGLPFIDTPWNPNSPVLPGAVTTGTGHLVNVDEVQTGDNATSYDGKSFSATPNYTAEMAIAEAGVSPKINGWYARFWMGEMFPDDQYASQWSVYGNLPTGSGNFYRVPYGSITMTSGANSTNGFDVGRTYQKQIGGLACTAFMNGTSSAGSSYGFRHTSYGSGSANLTTLGLNLYPISNFPLASPDSAVRPWTHTGSLSASTKPAEWSDPFYSGMRTTLSIPNGPSGAPLARIYYDSNCPTSGPSDGVWHSLGIIQMDLGTDTAWFSVSALAPQANFGTVELIKTGITTMIRTFLDGGNYAGNDHITQLPLIQISSGRADNQFSNPSAVTLTWASPVTGASSAGGANDIWFRWAGFNNGANYYTEEYPGYSTAPSGTLTNSTYTESVTVQYIPMYSNNEGVNWYYVNVDQGTAAVTGVYNSTYATTSNSIVWNVSSPVTFPLGTYRTRVEAYRPNLPLHFSYHALDINFSR